jgi:alpha-L-fucosidase
MNKKRSALTALLILPLLLSNALAEKDLQVLPRLEQNQRAFAEQRFGMFVCFNIMTYGAKWGEADYDISVFNPQKLDCNQWADAAVSANMKFGLLTTKHHEGFHLWDTQYSDYDVASTPYKKDIVRQFADAFREKNLGVGLYYSVGDNTHGIKRGEPVTPEMMKMIKGQIRELLTNYGKVDFFVIDSWYWSVGHREVPFEEIRELIRELQPDCLLTDHTHLQALYHLDFPYFEGPFGAYPPEDNIMPSALGHCLAKGNGWFWDPKFETKKISAKPVIKMLGELEPRYCNLMLNCMPNRDGLLGDKFTTVLKEIGENWQPNENRPPLPPQGPQLIFSIQPETATATSGMAENAVDSKMNKAKYSTWKSAEALPQSFTMDLGASYSGLEMLAYVPAHARKPERSETKGNITTYNVSISEDGKTFETVAEGTWKAEGKMQIAIFPKTRARYVRLEALDASGGYVAAEEIGVGSFSAKPVKQQ